MKMKIIIDCPKFLLREHQKHLAAEWSGWIIWIKSHL